MDGWVQKNRLLANKPLWTLTSNNLSKSGFSFQEWPTQHAIMEKSNHQKANFYQVPSNLARQMEHFLNPWLYPSGKKPM